MITLVLEVLVALLAAFTAGSVGGAALYWATHRTRAAVTIVVAAVQPSPVAIPERAVAVGTGVGAAVLQARVKASPRLALWRSSRTRSDEAEPALLVATATAPIARTPPPAPRPAERSPVRSPVFAAPRPARPALPAVSVARPAAAAFSPLRVSDDSWPAPAEAWPILAPPRTSRPVRSSIWTARLPRSLPAVPTGTIQPPEEIWFDPDTTFARRPAIALIETTAPGGTLADDANALDMQPRQRPPAFSAPPNPRDNLRKIKGVGQGFERRLHQLGIYLYVQVAAWTEAEQRWISHELGAPGRVENEDWIEQAVQLEARRQAQSERSLQAEIAGDPQGLVAEDRAVNL